MHRPKQVGRGPEIQDWTRPGQKNQAASRTRTKYVYENHDRLRRDLVFKKWGRLGLGQTQIENPGPYQRQRTKISDCSSSSLALTLEYYIELSQTFPVCYCVLQHR